jgi:lipopolysaccharide heptosyltransferase II
MIDRLVYLLYLGATRGIACLPMRVVFALGSWAGEFGYWVAGAYRRLVMANLRIAFAGEKGERELRALARQHFRLLLANLLSSVKAAQMPLEALMRHVELERIDRLTEPLKQGRGAVAVIPHLGNWELLSVVASTEPGLKFATVFQALRNPWIDADVRRARERFGMTVFDRANGFAEASKHLAQPGALGVVADQHAGDGGIWVPFFGRLASATPLPAMLAARTGAAVVPIAVYTVGPARWKIATEECPPLDGLGIGERTAVAAEVLERMVRRSPADWFWVHDRWKTPRPEFLLANYKRGVAFPPGYDESKLKPFGIAVRSPNWLGDAVMAVPAVCAIRAGRPDARVTVVCPQKLAEFWRRVPEVDAVIGIAKGMGLRGVARALRGKFDAGFIFPNSMRSALEMWLGGVPRRVGRGTDGRARFIDQLVPVTAAGRPPRHEALEHLDLARMAGGPEVPAVFAERPRRRRAGERPRVAVCPGAEYGPAKRWPAERYAEVARTVNMAHPCDWVLVGMPADQPAGAVIANALNRQCENLIGRTTLGDLIGLLEGCDVLLTNDTGTMHLASYLGVPVVAVFGSTEPALTGPMGAGARVIRRHVACSPCFLRTCPIDFRCMNEVSSKRVAEAVLAVVSG